MKFKCVYVRARVFVCMWWGGGGGGRRSVEVRHLKQTNFAALLLLAPCGELPFSFVGGKLKSKKLKLKNKKYSMNKDKPRKSTHSIHSASTSKCVNLITKQLQNNPKYLSNTTKKLHAIIISFSQKLVDS